MNDSYDQPTVLIETSEARKIEGISAKSGKPYKFFVQPVLFFRPGERWPTPTEITLPNEREGTAYTPGEYDLDYQPYTDRNSRINVSFVLTRRKAAVAA